MDKALIKKNAPSGKTITPIEAIELSVAHEIIGAMPDCGKSSTNVNSEKRMTVTPEAKICLSSASWKPALFRLSADAMP